METQEFYAVIGETMVNGGEAPERIICPVCRNLKLTNQELELWEKLTSKKPIVGGWGCKCKKKDNDNEKSDPYIVVRIPIEQRIEMFNTAEVWVKVVGTKSKKMASKVAGEWVKTKDVEMLNRDNEDREVVDGAWEVKGPIEVQQGNEHEDEPDYCVVVGAKGQWNEE